MGYSTGERDIERAKDLRKQATGVKSEGAKRTIGRAADRLEARGAAKLGRIGRKRVKKARLVV